MELPWRQTPEISILCVMWSLVSREPVRGRCCDMTDYVVTATLQDNISAGANAAADSMNKAADAADQLTASVTKGWPERAKSGQPV